MNEAKSNDNRPIIQKVGVAWIREFKGGKKGLKISINKELFVAYENKKASKPTDPNYVICKFIDQDK